MIGHKKGALTDASYERAGRCETANKGSILLDEIGELDPVCQVKLLRVLQDQTFEPLGDSRQHKVDNRVISSTNRSLPDMVGEGTFREDLFYRINLITIRMPSLRERAEDIPLLVHHFAEQQARANDLGTIEISPDAMSFLKKLPYPGNIRELKNLVERTILVSGSTVITEEDFRSQYTGSPSSFTQDATAVSSIEEIEKGMITRAWELYGGNHSKVAAALGISRQALYRRMEKYGLKIS